MTVTQEFDDDRILGTLNQPYTTRIGRTGWEISLAGIEILVLERVCMYVGIAALLQWFSDSDGSTVDGSTLIERAERITGACWCEGLLSRSALVGVRD